MVPRRPLVPVGEHRIALVIGNGAYVHAPRLLNPVNDAEAMAAVLGRLGFEVVKGIDLDFRALRDVFGDFKERLREAPEVALLYYSGHGQQFDGKNYLLPVDVQIVGPADLARAIRVDDVLDAMASASARLVFLDACRANPFARSLALSLGDATTTGEREGLARIEMVAGAFVAFATTPDMVAAEGSGQHSPFTSGLLRHIERPDQSINELMTAVSNTVRVATAGRQEPWTQAFLMAQFYFVPPRPDRARLGFGPPRPAQRAASPPDAVHSPSVARLEVDPEEEAEAAWAAIRHTNDLSALTAFLERYPNSRVSELAQELARQQARQRWWSWPRFRRYQRVDATAFCPRRLKAGEAETVQVIVHRRNRRGNALKTAREADRRTYFAAPSRDLGTLSVGDEVAVSLDVKGARMLDHPEAQHWTRETLTFAFRVSADGQAKQVAFNAVLTVNGAHVGRIVFTRPVSLNYSLRDILTLIVRPRLSRFKRVFFSYSSKDRAHVLRVAAEYEKFGVSFFQDILSLDPGERWQQRLWKEIDRCDIFVLFWSKEAAKSTWVIKEAERAWLRQARNGGMRPVIRPEVLEHPAPKPEQEWLNALHFDDPKYYRDKD